MNHKLLAALTLMFCTATTALQAQNGFNLPYSQFGIGLGEAPYNMPAAARLGGATLTRSGYNFLNPFNPASYAAIERESFVFDMGLGIQLSNLRDNNQFQRDADGNLSHLAIAFPLTGWMKVAAGLMPVSSVEYESVTLQDGVKTTSDGTGGTNQLFAGAAFNIPAGKGRNLSAGFNVGYLYGSIQRAITYSATGSDTASFMNSRKQKDSRISNATFDFGLQLRQPLGSHYTLAAALTYKPYLKMALQENIISYTFTTHASDEYILDTIFPARGNSTETESHLEQPHTLGLGLCVERNGRWSLSADATFSPWHGLRYSIDERYSILGESLASSGPFSRYAAGFEKMGNMDASTYWGRIGWSVGAHLDRGLLYLSVGNVTHRFDQWGIGGGMSLPMRKGRSLLTLSIAYNSFGNTDLLQRNSVSFGISVSSCERWFVKRKYN